MPSDSNEGPQGKPHIVDFALAKQESGDFFHVSVIRPVSIDVEGDKHRSRKFVESAKSS